MRPTTVLALILSSALLLSAPGCYSSASAGAGDAAATFNKATGNLTATTNSTLDAAFDAAQGAMNDMGYSTSEAKKDYLQGIIKAREADGGLVSVELERKADKVTQIEVGVGAFGNESKARLILEKILARLGR
ncbi:MAG TPA: DUF3568 family protein [Phycisphaerales bacterium]|nr:DUF3568 family protein [Phycisphaerales bacterium]